MRTRLASRAVVALSAILIGTSGHTTLSQAPPDPSVAGQWSAVQGWPIVSVHAHLLPTGKVMFYSFTDGSFAWDPATNSVTPLSPAGFNLFCTGHSYLPDGRLLLTGGHIANNVGLPNAVIYNAFTDTWTDQPDMNAGRWYPTNTTLPNGDVLVVSGDIDRVQWVNPLPQVWQLATGTWRDLTSAQLAQPLYPFMFLAPNGRVFNAGPERATRYLNVSGSGAWSYLTDSNFGLRDYGSAVMYDTGKVLIVGGGDPPTQTAEVIDLADPTPAWRYVSPMSTPRRQLNATLLPDGSVFASGGSSAPGFDNEAGAVYATEMWDPASDVWTSLAPNTQYRGYHSTAMLLPDGRVLSSGGDNHPSAEVFSPPYLFRGPRPTVTSGPTAWRYGQLLDIGTPDALSIAAVTMIRLSAVTHAFNQDQRIVRLPFTVVGGGVRVTAPSDRNLAPPGPYMLFLLDNLGVPSVAHMFHIADGTALAAPGMLTATAPLPNLVNLRWTDRSIAEDGYRIERAPGTSSTFTVIATLGQNATSYGDSTVSAATTSRYRVVAYNSSGSATSTAVSVTTPPAPAPTTGQGRRFNGTSDYIDLPSAPQVSTVTMGLFFTPLSLPAAGERDVLLTYAEEGAAEPFAAHDKDLFLDPDGTLKVKVFAGGVATAVSTTQLQIGRRYHIGFTSSSTLLTLYVDGVAESAVASAGSYAGYTDPVLRLAGLADGVDSGAVTRRAHGDMSGLGEWRVALSAAEMASLAAGTAATAVRANELVVAATLRSNPPVAEVGGPIVLNGTTFVPAGTAPAPPTGLTAIAVGANQVNLGWTDASSTEDGFRIRRAIGSSTTFATLATVAPNTTSFSDLTVAGSTAYTYNVEAYNSSGAAVSTNATVTTPAPATTGQGRRFNGTSDYIDFPSAPQVSTVTMGLFFTPLSLPAAGERDVLLTYGEQGTAEPFTTHDKQLYLAPDGTVTARVYAGTPVTVSSVTKLQVGQRYYVGFTSSSSTLTLYVNGIAEATATAPGSFTGYGNPTLRLAGLPGEVESGAVTRRAHGDVSGLGEWRVALSAAEMASLAAGTAATAVRANELVVAATLTSNPPVAEVGGPIVLNGTTFVPAGTAPAPPTGLTAIAVGANQVNLGWTDASSTEDGVRIRRAIGSSTTFATLATVAPNTTSFSDLTVAGSITYTYNVEAYNSSGAAVSTNATVTTPAPATTGQGRRFNGTSDYIDFPSAPQVSTVTMGLFFTPLSLPAAGERDVLLTYGEQGTAEPFTTHDKQLYLAPDGTVTARVYAGTPVTVSSVTKLQVGQRYYVGFTSSSSTLTLYVNGIAEATATAPGSFTGYGNPTLRLAGLPDGVASGAVTRRAHGVMSGLGEWRVALSAAEMASLATGTAATDVRINELVVAATLRSEPLVAEVGGPIVLNGTTLAMWNATPLSTPAALALSAPFRSWPPVVAEAYGASRLGTPPDASSTIARRK